MEVPIARSIRILPILFLSEELTLASANDLQIQGLSIPLVSFRAISGPIDGPICVFGVYRHVQRQKAKSSRVADSTLMSIENHCREPFIILSLEGHGP